MGFISALIESAVAVVAGLLGFGFLLGGAQAAAFGNSVIGTIVAFIGIVLLVFAAKTGGR